MEIREFITASLEQIASAIKDSHRGVFLVQFDIAVAVVDDAKGKGRARLEVAYPSSLGEWADARNLSETTSRISFKVPLALRKIRPDEERDSRELENIKAQLARINLEIADLLRAIQKKQDEEDDEGGKIKDAQDRQQVLTNLQRAVDAMTAMQQSIGSMFR